MRSRSKILLAIFAVFVSALAALSYAILSLQDRIRDRLDKGWVLPPLELYSQGLPIAPGRRFPVGVLEDELKRLNLQEGRDYVLGGPDDCERAGGARPESPHCLWLRMDSLTVGWNEDRWIEGVWQGTPPTPVPRFSLFPRLITQFHDGQPLQQQNTPLSEFPLACLQAVTAIEDRDFLEHKGVSASGIVRAIYRNLRKGRWAEGGSTITQQLVKNFFLTPKKTLRRKIEEQALAVLLESQLSKDQILEMYLNVIYMGQAGPYQIRGLGSAAQTVFDKPVRELNLSECALLAALINSPGRYNPFEHPVPAKARRELVLKKMDEFEMISDAELSRAAAAPLPKQPPPDRRAHAPYFVMAALKEFQSWDIQAEEGARIYTTLDPEVQSDLTAVIARVLPQIEKRVKNPSRQPLQTAMITVDLANAQILALVGGRDYRATQFNRAVDGRRQIGSIVKPFVYWPALREGTPLTEVLDQPFEWKAGRQVWKPRNFENGNAGPVPYFYALANSLNVPAARVGQLVGLEAIADTLRRSGGTSDAPLLPSLTLGALELSPFDVAQGYSTLARLGNGEHLHTLIRVEDLNGNEIFSRRPSEDLRLDPVITSVLVGMMKQTLSIGTAKSARGGDLQSGVYAGKTGTTSDTKDAWFVGFNHRALTVVWVGYDDNTAMGLTGAGAALPLWIETARTLESVYLADDFPWPEGAETRHLSKDEILRSFPELKGLQDDTILVFANWAT